MVMLMGPISISVCDVVQIQNTNPDSVFEFGFISGLVISF